MSHDPCSLQVWWIPVPTNRFPKAMHDYGKMSGSVSFSLTSIQWDTDTMHFLASKKEKRPQAHLS